jgi:hypothetical protein
LEPGSGDPGSKWVEGLTGGGFAVGKREDRPQVGSYMGRLREFAAAGIFVGRFAGDLVIGFEHQDGDFGFYPDLGFFEVFGGDVFEGVAYGFGGEHAAFFRGVEFVGGFEDAFGGGEDAFVFGDLEDPADEIAACGEVAFGVGDEDGELLFEGGGFFFVELGLDEEVHVFDDLAEHGGLDLVFLEDFGYLIDVDFWHGNLGGGRHTKGGNSATR